MDSVGTAQITVLLATLDIARNAQVDLRLTLKANVQKAVLYLTRTALVAMMMDASHAKMDIFLMD